MKKCDCLDRVLAEVKKRNPEWSAILEDVRRAAADMDELLGALAHALKRDHPHTEWCDGCAGAEALLARYGKLEGRG